MSMVFVYNPYVWIYFAAAAALLATFIFTIYKKSRDYLWAILQLTVMFWCVGFGLQISSPDLDTARFWYLAANDFVGFKTPSVLLLWSLMITGRKSLITKSRFVSLFIIPLITDVLNLTNAGHGLMYRRMWMDTIGGYPVLHFNAGYWYWIVTVYCGILLFIVAALIINDTLNRKLLHTKQGLAVAVVTVLVLLSIIIVLVTDGSLFNYYDPTPLIISAIIVGTTVAFKLKKQEPVPIPRNVVIDRMTSAVLILDNNNRIMDMNATAEKFLGLKAENVSGYSIETALSGWKELVKACVEKTDYSEFSRDQRYYKVYISILSDERSAAGKIVIIQDVTEYKEIETRTLRQEQALIALQERNRIARELHDSLGQVLGYINMQIEVIRKMLKNGQPQTIDSSLVALSRVVEEANIEVREFIYEVKTTMIFKNGFFSALMQYLLHFEQNFNIHIETKNPDNITDELIGLPIGIQLFRIIQEALANVRKHAKADKVTITFENKDNNILLSISDNGVGFNPENANCGTSFGLTVMNERANHISGQIKIDSAPSRGTTVTVVFPQLSAARMEAILESHDTVSDTPKIRVLLADDHLLFMDGLQKLIEQHNYKVVGTAKDGYEALEKARMLRPDVILMDLQMPRCNGITATRLINMEMPEIKIVILSMSDREHDLFKAIKYGASGYLLKGLCAEDFIEQLNVLASNRTVISPEIASQVMEEFNLQKEGSPETNPEECLSKRQIEILSLISKGLTYKEVAAKLYISERTVKYEMSDILKLLHLRNRSEAISYAQKAGLFKDK